MAKINFYNFLGIYNKAYKSKIVDENDFNKFIDKLKKFYKKLDETTITTKISEDTLKGIFQEKVLNDYETLVNAKRVDLSIKENNKTSVIFEFKTPDNKNEMLQSDNEDINKKALQEAIWYFYNQDSKEISYNIKNVIITDTEHLFFFNPKYFCNKELEKICLQFKNNQLAYNTTDILYAQIGDKIKEKNIQFEYAEFNLIQYKKKILDNALIDKDIKQLKYLYKALSPDFLLRKYSPKDSNELNARFYQELLYILGLKEEGKDKKKIIASDVKNTLRDRIFEDLNCSVFEDSINLIIIWLNRLLFLKLFEGQLISFNNNDKSYAFLNFDKISDFAKLNRLFFNILGKPLPEREEPNIPYLNSSLFERAQLESKYGNISNIDNNTTLPLYRNSILSHLRNYPQNPPLLKYLLDFLEAYNFSSHISEENKNKDIINSSVLGLIFEKLNGYKDGSFFTPAYITEYMAENAINSIVLRKFNELFKGIKAPCETIEELKKVISFDLHKQDRNKLYNEIIDDLRICDPAVGSGHFLVSILNYIIALKSELGLLPISNKIEIQNDTLVIYEQDGENQFEYKRDNQNSLYIQKTIFEEKRKIIENCLFGVDINPNSVQICCLRLWIELLKNTYYIGNSNEMQILPNIDINIKEGNSLIGTYKVGVGYNVLDNVDGRTYEGKDLKLYKELVAQYKNTDNKKLKSELNKKIDHIKNQLYALQYDLFDKKQERGIYNKTMEWMIEFPEVLSDDGEFLGFDVIIGNPPYGVDLSKEEKEYFKDKYLSAITIPHKQKGSLDTYTLFIERGLQLTKQNADLLFIVPMSITSSDACVPIQNIMENACQKIKISSYSNRPTQIFDSAGLRVSIIELYNINDEIKNNVVETTKLQRKRKSDNPDELLSNLRFINSIQYKLKGRYAKISENIDVQILKKLFSNNPLGTYCNTDGYPIYYRTTGGRYFNVVTNRTTGSTQETPILLNKELYSSIGCILSSTLFWYFLQIYTDGLHIKDYEIKNFPIPPLTAIQIKQLEEIYEEYLSDIDKNAIVHQAKSYNVDSFKEYKIVKSIEYIHRIDDIVCKLYGLNDEETKYIKNYEIEYRTNDTED